MTEDERIILINQSANDIVTAIGLGLKNTDMSQDEADAVYRGVKGLATIITIFNVSIVELSANVGKLVALSEKDVNAAIHSEAEAMAEEKSSERAKRSFIGQK